MYNPLKILDDAFRKNLSSEKFKRRRLHPVLSWFELAAYFSFVPGIFLLLHTYIMVIALIVSGATVFTVQEAEKGRYKLAYSLLIFFNLLPIICSILSGDFSWSSRLNVSPLILVYYPFICIWGIVAIHKQKQLYGD